MKITKTFLKKELKEILKKFENEFPGRILTRDYYRQHCKSKNGYFTFWGDFKTFLGEGLGKQEIKLMENEKKLFSAEEENRELKKEKKVLLKKTISEELLIGVYKESLNKYSDIKIENKIIKKKSENHGILNLADWHLGEVVKAEEINYVNEYNKDIFIERADRVFNRFVEKCEKIKISDITLNFLGDLIGLDIHEELRRTGDLNTVDSLFLLQNYIIKKLSWLSKQFNSIKVNFVVGNHSRLCINSTKVFYKESAILNWEYIAAKQIELLLNQSKNKKIKIKISKSPFLLNSVNNTTFLLTHGNFLTQGGGGFAGLPFYGLASSSAKMYGALSKISAEKTSFNHIVIGHFHSEASIPIFNGGHLFIGGSLIGTNEFSLVKMKSQAAISQLFLIVDKKGNIEGRIDIRGEA